jgi:two-component SAPR family response regulator
VAKAIGRRAELVFVTAFDQYAVERFRHGAVDYLVKPVEPERLADTVQRLKERIAQPPATTPEFDARSIASPSNCASGSRRRSG